MDFLEFLRPTLKALILPPGSLLVLFLLGLLLGRRWSGHLLRWLTLIAFYLLSTAAATHWLAPFIETYPATSASQLQADNVQAILVLSGGYNLKNPELDNQAGPDDISMQRLTYALRLHRETGLPLIISGGRPQVGEPPLAEIFARWLQETAGAQTLALETKSATTWENLEYSAAILEELGIQRIALVTHAFHMPRSMLAAKRHGVDAAPAPFGYLGAKPANPSNYESLTYWQPSARQFRRNYLLLHELLGVAWYRFKD